MKHTRRKFVKSSAASLAIPAVFSGTSAARSTSANERATIALVGCGGRGTGDGKTSMKFGDLVAVCDVDSSHSANAKNLFQKSQAGAIDVYEDYRAIIDRKDMTLSFAGQ